MPGLSGHRRMYPHRLVRWIPIILLKFAIIADGYALKTDPGLPEDIRIINGSIKYSGTPNCYIRGKAYWICLLYRGKC